MNIEKFLKRYAKTYPKLSFEMKIVFALLFYSILFLVKLGDVGFYVYDTFVIQWKRTLQHSTTYVTRKKRQLQATSGNIRTRIQTFSLPHIRRPKWKIPPFLFLKRKKKRGRKIKHKEQIIFFPVSFRTRFKYFFLGTAFSFLFLYMPLLSLMFLQDLPNPRELSVKQIPQTTKIYDRNKTLLYEIYTNQNRTIVPLSDVPLSLQHATLAIEDQKFYEHPGFDIAAILRALQANFTEGSIMQGGSTLTQQLIKSSMLTPEQKVYRKMKELVLAFWAEQMYSKNEILEMYFNQIPYGGTAWGVEAAAEVYFDKHVKDLDLAESAFLAGITAAPTIYSPYGEDPTLWKRRQKEVLNRMVTLGYITKADAEKATKKEIAFRPQKVPMYAPHFVMYIKEQLIQKHGLATVEKGGLTVITTLDLKVQEMAEKIVKEEVARNGYLNLTNGAVVVTDPKNGDILAMVGSKDFDDEKYGKVNITTSLRQPGSTVKVITYSAALEKGMTAASILDDSRISFGIPGGQSYSPVNYDGRYFGRVPLRFALANSLNTTAVKTLNQVGIDTMVDLARDMGIDSWDTPDRYGLAVTLGGAEATMLDMATVFGTLANKGERITLNPVLKINDYKGNILEEKAGVLSQPVLSKGVAFIISDILADNQARSAAFGSNSALVIPGHTVSVKTGTSDYKRDNWSIGYTEDFVVTVWVGNNDNSPMSQNLASGITGAAPIFNEIMTNLLKDKPENKPYPPSEVTQRLCYGRVEYFIRGTETGVNCGASPNSRRYSVR